MDKGDLRVFIGKAFNFLGDQLAGAGDILNSNFSVALVGSAAGALGGAFAAQKIIERTKQREAFLSELRSTNAAIVVSSSICNAMLSLKKNHVKPLFNKFNEGVEAIHEFNVRRELDALDEGEQFISEADFRLFECPTVPIETLKDLVFNRISEHGRPLAALAHLDGILVSLDKVMLKRAQLVEQFKRHQNSNTFHYIYYGLTQPNGNTNEEYADVVEAIHTYTDDAIFFSNLISNDLMSHGQELRCNNSKFATGAPLVAQADFSGTEALGLMPAEENYEDWLKGFIKLNTD